MPAFEEQNVMQQHRAQKGSRLMGFKIKPTVSLLAVFLFAETPITIPSYLVLHSHHSNCHI